MQKKGKGGIYMKLAEALTLRADLQRRIAALRDRLKRNAKVQEGDTPAEDPAVLLRELDKNDLIERHRTAGKANRIYVKQTFFAYGEQITDDDREVANLLRKTNKPLLLVVNKLDHINLSDNLYEFYELGIGDPIGISAVNMLGLGDLLEAICRQLPQPDEDELEEDKHVLQLAVVGRPNVGKSSLVNRLLGQERTMVSNIAGTTRDAIDTRFTGPDGTEYNIPPASAANAPWRTNPSNGTACCAPLPLSAAATWRFCSSTPRTA